MMGRPAAGDEDSESPRVKGGADDNNSGSDYAAPPRGGLHRRLPLLGVSLGAVRWR